jgi:pimeloyl-ACP methyl ester carboxylesterase
VGPAASAAPATSSAGQLVDVGGFGLWIECIGEGATTVVFEAGLGSGREAFGRVAGRVAEHARVCSYDRAGRGRSDPRPVTTATAGAMADDLLRLIEGAGITGSVVLVGHSYGGMVVQLAANRSDQVAGVVLVDSSSGPQFADPFPVTDHVWDDRGTVIDQPATVIELAAVDLGSDPLIVLTQDGLEGEIGAMWAGYQTQLAALSSRSVHLTAVGAGHGIQDEAPDLVVAAVEAIVAAVEGAAELPPCEDFEPAGGACFKP